jgi:hypothetical protein
MEHVAGMKMKSQTSRDTDRSRGQTSIVVVSILETNFNYADDVCSDLATKLQNKTK